MSTARLVHASTLEGLFIRGLASSLTPSARERLRQAGLVLERRLAPVYALEHWKALLRVAAEEVYLGLPPADAHWKLGERFADGWLETFMGRTVRNLAEAVGPRQTLERLGRLLRCGNDFSEVRMVELGPQCFELWLNDTLSDEPTFMAGLLTRLLQVAGASAVRVEVADFNGSAGVYRVLWAPPRPAAWPVAERT